MSEVIESRVVEMRFDNSQFESNVRESMKTIDNLKSNLNFEGAVKGLDKFKVDIDASGAVRGLNEISEAASECDLSALTESTESVKLSFSALEIFAVTALGKIASAAIDAGAKAVNAFAIQPITDGFAEYNQQLKSTRVITSNTGQELEEVTRVLDDLNEYADKTIYSFGDMTQAMGYFTSALGKNSAESAAIIAKGISNWAASTGQGNEVAKRVMYQVSQGLSTGSFRLMDWKSIENTGAMAGQIYQKEFIKTAQELYGYTLDEIMVDKSGKAVTAFRDSLQSGWLTNEVFLKTMEKFANVNGDFQWMEDAATKILTFSDLLDTVREQLGTGWGDTWKIVFGTFEDSIKFFTGISDIIGKFIGYINDTRNAIVQIWSDMGGRKLLFGISEEDVGAVGKALEGILNLVKQVHDGFVDGFGSVIISQALYDLSEIISDFANGLERLSRLTIVYDVIKSISTVLSSVYYIIKDLYQIVEPFVDLAFTIVEKILSGISEITNGIANFVDLVATEVTVLSDKLTYPFKIASEFIAGTLGGVLDFISEKISSMFEFLKQFDVFGIFSKDISDPVLSELNKIDSKIEKTANNAGKGIKSVSDRLAALGIEISSENDLKGDGWQEIFWNAMNEEKKAQHYATELWEEVKKADDLTNGDNVAKTWLDAAVDGGFYDPGVYEELYDIWKQWAGEGEYASESVKDINNNIKNTERNSDSLNNSLQEVNKTLEQTEESGHKVSLSLSLGDDKEYEALKKEADSSGSYNWWDLISESDKSKHFVVDYWDVLTDKQREWWKQYSLELGLFTKEELSLLENTEKTVAEILRDRDNVLEKKKNEADLWWDLIDDDKKKQYFMGEYWDVLTDKQRESWRKRAEEYKLYDPEEYARLLSEMAAAEEAAFSPESTEEIAESTNVIGDWFNKASKIPVIGGFLEKFSWLTTKTVKNAKSFGSAVNTSFGGFFEFVKLLNGTDLTFFQKFSVASTYFKDHVVDYLGELVAKNFKSLGEVITKSDLVSKVTTFTSSVKERFTDFKGYVKDINANAQLTFHEKFNAVLDYFNTNILGFYGKQIKDKFSEIAEAISNNKIVTNLSSLGSATKTKFGEFRDYITELNVNTELTFPEKFGKALEFLKTNVIDYFSELINKNLKTLGIDIEKVGKEISDAFSNAANFILQTLNKFGINTEAIRKFFWNDDGTLKSIPEIITELGNKIEQALNTVKDKLRSVYEQFFPSTAEGELTGPLGWLISAKEKVDNFIESLFGSNKKLEEEEGKTSGNGLLTTALGVLGLTGGSSIMKTIGNMNSLFSFGKNVGIAGKFDFGKIAIGVALAAGAFGLLSKIDFLKLGIDFSGFTNYFKDSEGNLLSIPDTIDKISASISNSKIGQWVGNTSQVIGKNFSTAFSLLKEKSAFFGAFIEQLNGSDLTFPQKFSLATIYFKDHFVIPFGDLIKKNLKTIGIDIDGFLGKFKGTEGEWLSVGDLIAKVGSKISEEIEIQKKKFEQTSVGQWINTQIETFKASHPKLVEWLGSVKTNVSDVFNWVGDTAKVIGRNVSTTFTLFGDKFAIFKEHITDLNENTELTFPQKLKGALDYLKKDFIYPFAEIAKKNLKTIGIDLDAFFNYFKDNEGNWLSISDIITKVGTSIHDAFSDLKTKFEQSKFSQWICKKFDSISEWLGNFTDNIGRFIGPIIGGAGFIFLLTRIGQMFDFITSIGQVISGRTPNARAEAFAKNAQSLAGIIRDIAAAVLIISVALGGLSMLNQDELARASDSINQVLRTVAVLSGVFAVMSFFKSRKETVQSGALALLEISGAVMLIAGAFRLITTIKLSTDILWYLGILGVLMGMVVALGRLSPKMEGSKGTFIGMIGIATAVLEMVGALYLVQLMLESHQGIGWALVTLIGLVGTFAILCQAAKNVKWQSGLGLILMAYSLRSMVDSLEYLFESDFLDKFRDDLVANLIKIGSVFGALYLLAGANKLAGGGKAGLSMISIASSVLILTYAIEEISKVPTDSLLPALGVVTALTIVMGGVLTLYSKWGGSASTSLKGMIVTTTNIYSVVIAVLLLCAAVAALSFIDQTQLITAGSVVAGLAAVVGTIAVFMAKFSKGSSWTKSLGLLTSATSVAVAMGALLWALDHYIPDKSNLMTIAGSVSLLTGVIGTLGIVFALINEKLRVQFPSMGDMLKLFGTFVIVMAGVGTVLTLMANYIPENTSTERLWTITEIVGVLTGVVSVLAGLFGKLEIKFKDPLNMLFGLVDMIVVVASMGAMITLMAKHIPSDVDSEKLWSITETVGILTIVVAGLSAFFGTVANVDLGSVTKAAGAMLIFGGAIEVLALFAGVVYEWQGENIEKVVSIVERIGKGLMKMFDSAMNTLGKLNWWQLVAVLGTTVAALGVLSAFGIEMAVNIGGFILVVGLISDLILFLTSLIFRDQKKGIDNFISTVERLGKGLTKMFDKITNALGKLNWWQLVAVVGTAVAAFAALGSAGALIGANLAVFEIEMAAAAAIVVTIFDITLPAFEKFANDGIPIFEKIATGIIKIVSIIIEGIVANVETIIGCLKDFVAFATSDFDIERVEQAIGIASQLAEVIGAFVGDNFLDMLGKFVGEKLFGETNRDAFVKNAECLTEVLNSFKLNISFWTAADIEKVSSAVLIADQLTDVCNKFGDTGLVGSVMNFITNGKWGEIIAQGFVTDVEALGTSLNTFCTQINGISAINLGKAAMALVIADHMIALVKKFQPDSILEAAFDALKNKWFADDNSNSFNTQITNLSGAVSNFCGEVENWTVPTGYESKFIIVDKMIEFIEKMPYLNADQMDFAEFGETIKEFCEAFKIAMISLNDALSKEGIKDYDSKIAMIDQLIEIAGKLPDAKSAMGQFFGYSKQEDFKQFGDDIASFAGNLKSFAETMNEVPELKDWDTKKTVVQSLIDMAKILPEGNSVGENLVGYDFLLTFGQFGKDIASFAESFDTFVTKLNGFDVNDKSLEKLGYVIAIIGMLSELAKTLPQSFTKSDVSGSAESISTFTQSFSEFMHDIIGDKDFNVNPWGKTNFSNTLFDQINRIFGELDKLGEFTDDRKSKLEMLASPDGPIQMLSNLAKNLPSAITKSDSTLTSFGADIVGFANNIVDATGALSGAGWTDESGNALYKFDPKPLEDMAKGVSSIITAFGGVTDAQLTSISSIMESISKLKDKEGNGLGQVLLNNLVSGLFDIPKEKIEGAQTNVGNLTGMLGDLSGLGTTLNSIVPEGGFNLGSLEELFGTFQNGSFGEGGILNAIPNALQNFNSNFTGGNAIDLSGVSSYMASIPTNIAPTNFDFSGTEPLLGEFANGAFTGDGGYLNAIPDFLQDFGGTITGDNAIDLSGVSSYIGSIPSQIMPANFDFSSSEALLGKFTAGTGFDGTGFLGMVPVSITNYIGDINGIDPKDIKATNGILGDLVSGVAQAGTITPELSTNFNTTLSAFATNGIQSYLDTFTSNETETKLNNTAKIIVDKTGTGIDSALKVTTNKIRTAAKTAVQIICNILSGDSSNPYAYPGPIIIDKLASGITNNLALASSKIRQAAQATVKLICDILAGDNTNPYDVPGPTILEKVANGITMALNGSSNSLDSSVRFVVDRISSILSGNNTYPNPYTQAGENVISGFNAGMRNTDSVYNTAYNVGERAVKGLNDAIDSHSPSKEAEDAGRSMSNGIAEGLKSAGEDMAGDMAEGFSDGMENYEEIYIHESEKIGHVALSHLGTILKINSPSKETMKYGQYFSEGFGIGINKYSNVVENASENIGNDALLSLSECVDNMHSAFDSDTELRPTITNKKDLYEIQNLINSITMLLTKQQVQMKSFEASIDLYVNAIQSALKNVGNEALLSLTSYIDKVYTLLDSNMEFSPTITPVLDLSEIQNGINSLNLLLSRQYAYQAGIQVNQAKTASIEGTRQRLTTDNSRNYGGFTFNIYTQGTDADAIARQIGVEVARKLRTV